MKVLLIGNGNRKTLGQSYYAFDARVLNGLIRNGHSVLFYSDRDEIRAKEILGIRHFAEKGINQDVLAIVRNFRPDVILLGHARLIHSDTLDEARDIVPGLRIGVYSLDALYAPHNVDQLNERKGHVDAMFITSGGPALKRFATGKQPVYFMPNITDSGLDTGRAFEKPRTDLGSDLCYFAHNARSVDDSSRSETALYVEKSVEGLRCHYRGFDNRPRIAGADFIPAFGDSAMSLNISRNIIDGVESTPETRYLYSSDRIACITGNGALGFLQNDFGLQELFEEDCEAVFFANREDLAEKVRRYFGDDAARRTIAEKGWQKAHTCFNEKLVTQYMLERILDKPLSASYAWPTQGYTA